jgi:hypothetical protein
MTFLPHKFLKGSSNLFSHARFWIFGHLPRFLLFLIRFLRILLSLLFLVLTGMSEDASFESFVDPHNESLSSESSESGLEPSVRCRLIMEYRLLREFTTTELFNDWWQEAKKGWQRKTKQTNGDGQEVHLYM